MADPLEDPGPDDSWGRMLDAAGIVAGLLLLVILADVATDGRVITRRLIQPKDNPGDPAAE